MRQIIRPHLTPFYVDAIRGVVRGGQKALKSLFKYWKNAVFSLLLSQMKNVTLKRLPR